MSDGVLWRGLAAPKVAVAMKTWNYVPVYVPHFISFIWRALYDGSLSGWVVEDARLSVKTSLGKMTHYGCGFIAQEGGGEGKRFSCSQLALVSFISCASSGIGKNRLNIYGILNAHDSSDARQS